MQRKRVRRKDSPPALRLKANPSGALRSTEMEKQTPGGEGGKTCAPLTILFNFCTGVYSI